MKTYPFPSRALPLDDSWDVVVVGGGPAGCTAAASAAREGAKTLLIEATGALGGMGTSALVPAWTPFSDREKIIYRSMAERVFTAAKQGVGHVGEKDLDWVPIDPERLKRVYDDLVSEHGATVLFGTMLAAVEKDESGGGVRAIVTNNKAGLRAYSAKVYVDCTGDADLCAWAGAEFHIGDEQGVLMPSTHCFVLTNVDEYAYRHGPNLYQGNPNSPIYAVIKSGKYPLIPDVHCCSNLIGPRTVGFNAGHLFNVNSTDPASTSKALMMGRKLALQLRDALAEFFPAAFGNAFLVTTGSLLGIRESRRIIGDYVLTLRDYIERRSFDDEICRNAYFIDVHAKVKEQFRDQAAMTAWEKTNIRYDPGESHGIPYRCLTPKGLRNVMVAGRSISCEQIVQGSVRVMPVCLAMGEAAGMAAAIAASAPATDVHAVDVQTLRRKLKEHGAYLDLPTAEAVPRPSR